MSEDLVVPVQFKFHIPWASKILLAGFFNDWKGEPMNPKHENGEHYFELVKLLNSGDVQYKYIVFFDHGYYEWHYEAHKPTFVDPLGNINNIKSIIVDLASSSDYSTPQGYGASSYAAPQGYEPIFAVKNNKKAIVEEIIAAEEEIILAAEAVTIDDDDEPIDIPKAEEEEDGVSNIDVAALEKTIDPVLLKKCKATFSAVDKDGSGLIQYEEFIVESKRLNVGLSEVELTKKFKEKDLNGDGQISWGEFLLAMVSHSTKKKR